LVKVSFILAPFAVSTRPTLLSRQALHVHDSFCQLAPAERMRQAAVGGDERRVERDRQRQVDPVIHAPIVPYRDLPCSGKERCGRLDVKGSLEDRGYHVSAVGLFDLARANLSPHDVPDLEKQEIRADEVVFRRA
jgi:hypothetical protein